MPAGAGMGGAWRRYFRAAAGDGWCPALSLTAPGFWLGSGSARRPVWMSTNPGAPGAGSEVEVAGTRHDPH